MAINIGNMVPLFTPKHTGSADSMERQINSRPKAEPVDPEAMKRKNQAILHNMEVLMNRRLHPLTPSQGAH